MADEKSATPPTVTTGVRTGPKVKTVTGQEITLLHEREKVYYEAARDQYLEQYEFTHANDFRTLDRLILLEVQYARFQWYTSAEADYDNVVLHAKEMVDYRRAMKEIQIQIQEAQKDLGVTKAQRESAGADSIAGYIADLRLRAQSHGVKREKELGKAIELCKELFALTGAYSRSNENERRKIGFESGDDIVAWCNDYMKPEFDRIDAYFREHDQRAWVRTL